MILNLKKILSLLSAEEKTNIFLLLILVFIVAVIDVIGVASILPFVAVLTNPEIIETNSFLNTLFQLSKKFGVENKQNFLFFLGIMVFGLLIVSLILKLLATYFQAKFSEMCHFNISKRLVEGYLNQPYSWFLDHHSANLGKTILSEVGQVIALGLNPLIHLISKCMIVFMLIFLLILVDAKLAFLIGVSLGGIYALIFYFLKDYIDRIGKKLLKNNELRFISTNEAFGIIKQVKVGGLEKAYLKKYSASALSYAQSMISSQVISQLPRFILEAIAFGGTIIMILYLMMRQLNFIDFLPIITLYVFAGYRLMPAMQQVYSSLTQMTFVGPSLNNLSNNFKNLQTYNIEKNFDSLNFKNKISLKNVYFKYPNSSRTILNDLTLNIPIKSKLGIIGVTGSGKTTAVDIILGLLQAQKGTLEVDDQVINENNVSAWQRMIGYVPQDIYLTDESVEANIAFGLEKKDINNANVERVSKIANLHDFVMSELDNQYQTIIGENGVKLSGGQRQRIAIARALYFNPKVLILDEASSALDVQTEKMVMDAVKNISKDITIILVAHRLNTVKDCDIIVKLDKGHLVVHEENS